MTTLFNAIREPHEASRFFQLADTRPAGFISTMRLAKRGSQEGSEHVGHGDGCDFIGSIGTGD